MKPVRNFLFVWTAILTVTLTASGCSKAPGTAPSAATAPAPSAGPVTFTLPNGLEVTLRPVAGADQAALVVVYDVGEGHDPAGKSGLSHLAEHCYVTAAPAGGKARGFEAIMARYPAGFNAQTGVDYTVFATVFPAARLTAELDDAAARMASVAVTPADLTREVPRLCEELGNMYGNMPPLGALNLARALVCPSPSGGRKGGIEAQVSSLAPADVQGHLDRFYKPVNAHLVLAGALRPDEARKLVTERFGGIAAGEKAPVVTVAAPAVGNGVSVDIERPLPAGGAAAPAGPGAAVGCAAVAVRAPRPSEPDYAAFLAAAARLFERANPPGGSTPVRVICAILDDPDVLVVQKDLAPGERPEKAYAGIDAFLAAALGPPFAEADRVRVRNFFGFLLGLMPLPDGALAQNLYGVAFGLAMGRKLGLDPGRLNAALDALDEAKFRAAVTARFAPDRRGRAVVTLP
ncbi:MAG: insulinase family protein [Acidobacteria bacterium]|nr:insulinase family protein [Acidobacteriota bacterium]